MTTIYIPQHSPTLFPCHRPGSPVLRQSHFAVSFISSQSFRRARSYRRSSSQFPPVDTRFVSPSVSIDSKYFVCFDLIPGYTPIGCDGLSAADLPLRYVEARLLTPRSGCTASWSVSSALHGQNYNAPARLNVSQSKVMKIIRPICLQILLQAIQPSLPSSYVSGPQRPEINRVT